MAADDIINVDLTSGAGVAGAPRFTLVPKGKSCTQILMMHAIPASADFNFQLQVQRGSGVPVAWEFGQYWKDEDGCHPDQDGEFLIFPPQPGITAVFYVQYEGPAGAGFSGVH